MLFLLLSTTETLHAIEETEAKDPGKAFIFSLIIPGSGQIYNGKYIKAIAYIGIDTYMFYTAYDKQESYKDTDNINFRDERNKYIWWGMGTWLLGAIDAYVDAHLSLFPSENLRLSIQNGDMNGFGITYHF